jgi:hypothetical protein
MTRAHRLRKAALGSAEIRNAKRGSGQVTQRSSCKIDGVKQQHLLGRVASIRMGRASKKVRQRTEVIFSRPAFAPRMGLEKWHIAELLPS